MPDPVILLENWRNEAIPGENLSSRATSLLKETEKISANGPAASYPRNFWLTFLDVTAKPLFLQALQTPESRNRWAELVFRIIRDIDYNLRDLMEQRVTRHPGHVLFRDMASLSSADWTYEQIYRHLREIAAVFYGAVKSEPRVAIYTENCLEGACTDLACLMYGIFDTPVSPHFKPEIVAELFNRLGINIALADSEERLTSLKKVREKTVVKFRIFSLQPAASMVREIPYLAEEGKKISKWDLDALLSNRAEKRNTVVATTMFTSGSTGLPKGVSFSIYNIVSKRFARAAALPDVGDVVFLSYLPLFHTFGRYLEMTGAIFWSGTYVFAGNTSAETLMSLFPRVNPTGFISIPLRWQELYEKCQERIGSVENLELRTQAVRDIVGSRLHWGLSAAGYLDPAVFRFFNNHGIQLNSGFGMTEATGGITMTPPGKYRDNTVGIPLPGVRTRLNEGSELELSGHYIGRYLEDAGPGDTIPSPVSPGEDHWMPTGDVFRISRDGYYQIVDRVKDIYKNNRGQTVAPQTIEKKFFKVPGIRNVFLVGDNRPYNVLLIVPDRTDPLFNSLNGDNLNEYFHQIVTAANTDVAPYERVINFALLERDFSRDKEEVTAKGSFNRKTIEKNFKDQIELLYQSNMVRLTASGFTIVIPKWFFRDLGILETDISYSRSKLRNHRTKATLPVRKLTGDWYRVGHLKYRIKGETLDFGVFARQPGIWLGNPSLTAFCPVKEGWDVPTGPFTEQVRVIGFMNPASMKVPALKSIRDNDLIRSSELIIKSFFGNYDECFTATEELGKILSSAGPRLAMTIISRLESLAYHPEEEIRCLAYRLILLKTPRPEEITAIPPFIESGLSFLNERSIRIIASGNFGKHRLDALKQRLYYYRTTLKWPVSKKYRQAFTDVLGMLYNFAILHLEFYVPVRAELSRWILHRKDPALSRKAGEYFYSLASYFEREMEKRSVRYPLSEWKSRLVFEHGIPDTEKRKITGIFQSTTFLKESIILTFNEQDFEPAQIPAQGIWILRLLAYKEFKHYRLSINTTAGRHYDLHMVMSENPAFRPAPETFYWMASLAGFPYGPAVAPLLGSSRPALGILTTQYIGGLTAWDKIRELSEIHRSSGYIRQHAWKKIFIKAFTVIFKAWHHSGFQIVPGGISPSNVAIPEMDFRENAVVLSLAGWSPYKNTLSLVVPMLQDYYAKIASIFPWCRNQLDVSWIFDACIEALGKQEAFRFLEELRNDLDKKHILCYDQSDLMQRLDQYLQSAQKNKYIPVTLFSAIDQYQDWHRMNPLTTPQAREQTMSEFIELYKLQQYGEFARFFFYRHTYFKDGGTELVEAFDRLLKRMEQEEEILAIQLIELSDLQSVIHNPDDKNIFSRMVFPRLLGTGEIDFLKVGDPQKEHVVVRFPFKDKAGRKYILREPVEPRETGQLYQLFFRENYPKEISGKDHLFVTTDESDKIVGGMTWRYLDDDSVLLDGIVVTSVLQGKGIASGMIVHFFASMSALGIKIVKAHFLFGNYYMKHFFEVDKKWGALVRMLN